MEIKERIETAKNEGLKIGAEPIIKGLEDAIKNGYEGFVYGYFIPPSLGAFLNNQGIKYKTYSDGEFEQSEVWI